MSNKQCWPWPGTAFYGVRYESKLCSGLSVQTFMICTVNVKATVWTFHLLEFEASWSNVRLDWARNYYIEFPYHTRTIRRPRWLSWMRRPTGDQEVGNILSWRLIMKYFQRSFSPFCWFKKGSCQFLTKECAQYCGLSLPSIRVVR